jgi:hypothetical protein
MEVEHPYFEWKDGRTSSTKLGLKLQISQYQIKSQCKWVQVPPFSFHLITCDEIAMNYKRKLSISRLFTPPKLNMEAQHGFEEKRRSPKEHKSQRQERWRRLWRKHVEATCVYLHGFKNRGCGINHSWDLG